MRDLRHTTFSRICRCAALSFVCLGLGAASSSSQSDALLAPDRLAIAIEALNRLDPAAANRPEIQQALQRVLVSVRGSPQFLQLVKRFQLSGQENGLLEIALLNSENDSGAEAMRLLLASGSELVKSFFQTAAADDANRAIAALGNAAIKEAVPLLLPLVTDSSRGLALRKNALRALAKTSEGAAALLALAEKEKLPGDLKFIASAELNAVRWPKIKERAAVILPLPQIQNAAELPSISELLARTGDPSQGEKVFFRDESACAKCHRVGGKGIEIGPDLSEIGTKLGKEALLESILDPDAGISLGYEAYQIISKSGDEFYGLLVSETEDELAIKNIGGIVTKIGKSQIASRDQLKNSMMPAGLQSTMSADELVDLIEYLASLKKAGN